MVLAVVAFVIVQSVLYGWVYLAGFGILSLVEGSWYVGAALLIAAVLQRLVVYRVVGPRFERGPPPRPPESTADGLTSGVIPEHWPRRGVTRSGGAPTRLLGPA